MTSYRRGVLLGAAILALALPAAYCRADSDDATRPQGKYGLFGLLDGRSQYGTDLFPEPLVAEEGDLEKEFRTTWYHTEGSGAAADLVTSELEYAVGMWTFEVESGYERDVSYDFDPGTGMTSRDTEQGTQSVELTARHPIWQMVSDNGFFDNTVVAGMAVSLPTHTAVSDPTELEPQMWDLLRLGDNLTFQTRLAFSAVIDRGPDAGQQTLEYSATLGYTVDINHPGVLGVTDVTPMVELLGTDPLNKSDVGDDSLQGDVGAEIGFSTLGFASPKLLIGYATPIDAGARHTFRWGVVSSILFDF